MAVIGDDPTKGCFFCRNPILMRSLCCLRADDTPIDSLSSGRAGKGDEDKRASAVSPFWSRRSLALLACMMAKFGEGMSELERCGDSIAGLLRGVRIMRASSSRLVSESRSWVDRGRGGLYSAKAAPGRWSFQVTPFFLPGLLFFGVFVKSTTPRFAAPVACSLRRLGLVVLELSGVERAGEI